MLSQRLRHRIDIDHKVEEATSSDEYDGFRWEPFAEDVPAEVLTGPGREPRAANAKQVEVAARITIRFLPGLTQQMRVRWNGNVYDISGLATDATATREHWLECTGGLSNGA